MTPPASSTRPMRTSTVRRLRCASSAEKEEPAIWFAAVATATAGGMPMKKRSGVRMNPPPTPKSPDSIPTIGADAEEQQHVHGDFGDGEIDLHGPGGLSSEAA